MIVTGGMHIRVGIALGIDVAVYGSYIFIQRLSSCIIPKLAQEQCIQLTPSVHCLPLSIVFDI